jgi:hypothetical protein
MVIVFIEPGKKAGCMNKTAGIQVQVVKTCENFDSFYFLSEIGSEAAVESVNEYI